MHAMIRRYGVALLLGLAAACSVAQADDAYRGSWFRVTGQWDGIRLVAERLDLREPGKDARHSQVIGRVDKIDTHMRSLTIGPFFISWSDKTGFEGINAKELRRGAAVRVSMEKTGLRRFHARSIELRGELSDARTLQVTGQVMQTHYGPTGAVQLFMLDVPVDLRQAGYNRAKSLTRRLGSRRPEQPLQTTVFGHPLVLSGEYEATLRERKNFKLDDQDDRISFDQEFKVELFYPFGRKTALFAELKALRETELRDVVGTRQDDTFFERGQMWLYTGGQQLGLQIGRQNLTEVREWWWDDDLDAVRLYSDVGAWHAELGVARELTRQSTLEKSIDVQHDGVSRIFGVTSWLWAPRQRIELFALHHDDRSGVESIDQLVDAEREDASDARLTWFGLRAIGEPSLGKLGRLLYWADTAGVFGDETVLTFSEVSDTLSRVASQREQTVRGYAYDVGASWSTKLALRPTFTLSYAFGSGDANTQDNVDRSFRQTGLNENKWRFGGVNRFRYYGELLRPELSNLGITTIAVGFPLLAKSSVELVYHRYRQVEAADSLRDVRIRDSLTGTSRDIGREVDIVFGFRTLPRWEFEFIAAAFETGDAYGATAGKRAYSASLEATLNF